MFRSFLKLFGGAAIYFQVAVKIRFLKLWFCSTGGYVFFPSAALLCLYRSSCQGFRKAAQDLLSILVVDRVTYLVLLQVVTKLHIRTAQVVAKLLKFVVFCF
ncbi:hypothetical protein U1Q18_012822 [Sarracenia purpurea var. burkii]